MVSVIRGIFITGLLLYTSLLYHSTALAHLGYASAALFALSGVFCVVRLSRMRCRLFVPVTVAQQARPFSAQLIVENKGRIPSAKVWCLVELSGSFLKRTEYRWLRGGVVLNGENRYRFSLEFEGSGNYRLALKKIRVYDPAGLFYLQKKVDGASQIQVFPKMREIGVLLTQRVKNFYQDADVFDDHMPGSDYSELFQTRPFQNGDRLRQVHWKLSARMDELFVREGSMPLACPVVFLLDYSAKNQGGAKGAAHSDAFLGIMASVSFSIMDAECPFYVAWHSAAQKDLVRMRVDGEEGLYLFFCAYLSDEFTEKTLDLPVEYKDKYRGESYVAQLMLNDRLELLKNGERIVKFAGKDWEKILEGLELVL